LQINRLHDLLWSEPCALTPVILEEVTHSLESRGIGMEGTALENRILEWSALMRWRDLYHTAGPQLESLTGPQWFTSTFDGEPRKMLVTGGPSWMALEEDAVRRAIDASAGEERALAPGLALQYADGSAKGDILAESTVVPALQVVVRDAPAYARAAWKRTGWLAGFAGLAVAGTLWGSRQMLRALRRQAELSRQKSNFIASISHELRTPLASLRVLSENLQAGRVSEEEMRTSYFPLMVDECRRLASLVENVLDFARAEEQRSVVHFAEADIEAMTMDTVQLIQSRAGQRGLHIEVDAPPLPQATVVDAMSLHRALLNLLDNAVKFTPAGGKITVRLRPDGPGWWSLSVSDTGPGIPPAEHGRIFERFYRTGSELTRTVPGTGIGLSIVQHVAEGHGGKVILRSAPGAGATFTLRLPCRPPQMRE
jgi:signal transduction histidine kinase